MQQALQKQYIQDVLLEKFNPDEPTRRAALFDVLRLTLPNMEQETARQTAATIPQLPGSIYKKWINLFIEKLFNTVPQVQITDLCTDSPENKSTLSLVFIMFLESERMESIIAEDLKRYSLDSSKAPSRQDSINI